MFRSDFGDFCREGDVRLFRPERRNGHAGADALPAPPNRVVRSLVWNPDLLGHVSESRGALFHSDVVVPLDAESFGFC